jgi:hypothetical protein
MTQPRRRNVAKLLARLNPKGMNLAPSAGNSRGGVPEETALDIAGALGYVSAQGPGPRLAAVVLCLRWWPGLIEGPAKVVGYREIRQTDLVRGEKRVRIEKLSLEGPTETAAFRFVAALLASRLGRSVERHHRMRTERPRLTQFDAETMARVLAPGFLAAWARAVIHEYRHPNHCQTCTPWGRAGEVPRPVYDNGKAKKVDWRTCDVCLGAGVLAWSAKRRAKMLRIGEHPWRNLLNPIHEGALSLLRELEWRGARALVRRLGG